jgi:hypothetical protein
MLPVKFETLEPFVNLWALETELQRSQTRWSASEQEYQDFYNAMMPVLDEVLEYIDQYELGKIPDETLSLYHLALAFAEAAPHNELYECANQVPNSFTASRFIAAHGDIKDR